MACAPTGSGKTVLFELAIVRLLLETSEPWKDVKAVYSKDIQKLNTIQAVFCVLVILIITV